MKLEHIGFNVAEPQKVMDWWCANLGFTQTHPAFVVDSTGQMAIEFYRNDAAPIPDYTAISPLTLHIAFLSEDVDADAARLVVAARDVSIALDRHDDQSIRNVLPAEIVSLEADPSEGRTLVTLRSGEETVLSLVTDESVERLQLRPGLSVWLQVKSVAVAL